MSEAEVVITIGVDELSEEMDVLYGLLKKHPSMLMLDS